MDDDDLVERLRRALDDGPVAPPTDRLASFRAQVEAQRRSVASSTVVPIRDTRRRMRPIWWGVAAASVVVVAGVAWAIAATRDDPGEIAGEVEFDGGLVDPTGVTRGDVTVTAIGIGRVVELHTDELPILPTGEYYEVWFVGAGDGVTGPNRISAGTFHPDADGRSDVQFAAAVDPSLYPVIEITAEPGDGDPSASDVVVLTAEITAPER